jgi:D-alanyl-D-alanine carboxypeptidase
MLRVILAASTVLLAAMGFTLLANRPRLSVGSNTPEPLAQPKETEQTIRSEPLAQPKETEQAIQPEPRPTAQAARNGVLLVNAAVLLPSDYNAGELVNLYDMKRSFQLANSSIRLTRETFEAANRMFAQAKRDGVDGFIITSGYRTATDQQKLYDNTTDGTAALPGASEHQTGLAFDVTTHYDSGGFEGAEQFRWLSEHCAQFGFILRYPKGKENITGIPYEPWHYRYVGVEIAEEIMKNGLTLEEYCAGMIF